MGALAWYWQVLPDPHLPLDLPWPIKLQPQVCTAVVFHTMLQFISVSCLPSLLFWHAVSWWHVDPMPWNQFIGDICGHVIGRYLTCYGKTHCNVSSWRPCIISMLGDISLCTKWAKISAPSAASSSANQRRTWFSEIAAESCQKIS